VSPVPAIRHQFPLWKLEIRASNSRRGAKIWCMFWCMLHSDVTAIYCNILQHRYSVQAFYSAKVMPIRALMCGLLQHSQVWTQNPPPSLAYEFDSRSRHHYNQRLRAESQNVAGETQKSADPCKSCGIYPFPASNIKHSSSIN